MAEDSLNVSVESAIAGSVKLPVMLLIGWLAFEEQIGL